MYYTFFIFTKDHFSLKLPRKCFVVNDTEISLKYERICLFPALLYLKRVALYKFIVYSFIISQFVRRFYLFDLLLNYVSAKVRPLNSPGKLALNSAALSRAYCPLQVDCLQFHRYPLLQRILFDLLMMYRLKLGL